MVGDELILSGNAFQITVAAKRKEQDPKLLLGGVGRLKCWSEERRERIG